MTASRSSVPLALLLLSACAGELPGHYFQVELVTAKDVSNDLKNDCEDPATADKESYTYRVVVEGPSARVYMDDDLLATGSLTVCALSYTSTTWQTAHGEGEVRWALLGDADVGINTGCDVDWEGTERLEVVGSTDPDVPERCSIEYDVTGTYEGEVP